MLQLNRQTWGAPERTGPAINSTELLIHHPMLIANPTPGENLTMSTCAQLITKRYNDMCWTHTTKWTSSVYRPPPTRNASTNVKTKIALA